MENPEAEIAGVIRSLTQGTREEQQKTLDDYFLPDAFFIHPFCRVPSFRSRQIHVPFTNIQLTVNSRLLILFIYQWYKILSPRILLEVDSVAHDKNTNSLYATIRQTFTIWVVPFSIWQANVQLVCLLSLELLPVDKNKQPLLIQNNVDNKNVNKALEKRYFIRGQQDHYQVNEFLKFIAPLGASPLYYLWQLFATFLSACGVAILWPVTSVYEYATSQPNNNGQQKANGNGRTEAPGDYQDGS